jgi:hypothetical protein
MDTSPVFVVSTGRAGSKMLSDVLALHPAACAFHEPLPQLNAEAFAKWRGRTRNDRIEARVAMKRRRVIEQISGNGVLYVESSHFCSHLIPELDRLFAPRFVHLIRNGRDVVKSGLRLGWYAAGEVEASRQRVATLMRRSLLIDLGTPGIDHRLTPPRPFQHRLDKIAWLWSEINGVILRDLEEIDHERKHVLKIEDFGPDTMAGLLSFLGFEAPTDLLDRMMEVADHKPNRSPISDLAAEDWDAEQERRFLRIAGPMMERLGYSSC